MAFFNRKQNFQLDRFADDLDVIRSWLDRRDAPVYDSLPQALVALKPIGCKQLIWKGQDVSLVCFHIKRGRIVHLFVLDLGGLDPMRCAGLDRVADSHELETGGWVVADRAYLLVGSHPDVDVEFALA